MKNLIQNIAIISVVGVFALGCAPERYEIFEEINSTPSLTMDQGSMGSDSVWTVNARMKMGLKTNVFPVDINIQGNDIENQYMELHADYNPENVVISSTEGEEITFPLVMGESNTIDMIVEVTTIGVHTISIELIDELGKITKGKINIDAFENDPPIAVLSKDAEYIGINSANEYKIKGGESFDQDADYGGYIAQYIWSINGSKEFITEDPFFHQDLEKKGYQITLRVIDGDGASSEKVSQVITIQ